VGRRHRPAAGSRGRFTSKAQPPCRAGSAGSDRRRGQAHCQRPHRIHSPQPYATYREHRPTVFTRRQVVYRGRVTGCLRLASQVRQKFRSAQWAESRSTAVWRLIARPKGRGRRHRVNWLPRAALHPFQLGQAPSGACSCCGAQNGTYGQGLDFAETKYLRTCGGNPSQSRLRAQRPTSDRQTNCTGAQAQTEQAGATPWRRRAPALPTTAPEGTASFLAPAQTPALKGPTDRQGGIGSCSPGKKGKAEEQGHAGTTVDNDNAAMRR